MGVIISIIFLLLIAVYAQTKFQIFLDYDDSTFMEFRDVNVRSKGDILSYEDIKFPFGTFSIRFNAIQDKNGTTYASNSMIDLDQIMDVSVLLHQDYNVTFKEDRVISKLHRCTEADWDYYFKDTEDNDEKEALNFYWNTEQG